MILIIGSTHDDILYFESVMTNRKEETIYNKFKIEQGNIFNQEVTLVYDTYTSYTSLLITNYLIEKYFVVLVFVVGKCVGFSSDVSSGDICISKRTIIGDVDQVKEANVKLGQIPNFPKSFESSEEVIGYISSTLEKRSFSRYDTCTFISANVILDTEDRLSKIMMDNYVLGHKNKVVFDCISGGCFLAANIHDIPIVAVKVVEKMINEPNTADAYIEVLKQYSNVGRSIVTCIGDIGRNDIIKE